MNKQVNRRIETAYIQRLKDGDKAAFRKIYEFYKDSIYYFALKIVKNRADAEEILQETFTVVYQSIGTLKSNDAFHSWIFSIAFNFTQSMYRKKAKHNESDVGIDVEDLFWIDNEQRTMVERKEMYDDVKTELRKLPEKFKDVGMMKYFEDLTIDEIAQELDIPSGTVKTRLQKIRSVIQPKLVEKGYFSES